MTDQTRNGEREMVSVDAEALREVLQALNGPHYLISELQACSGMPPNPIDTLVDQFNAHVEALAAQGGSDG